MGNLRGTRFAAILVFAVVMNEVAARDFARTLREHAKRTSFPGQPCVTDDGTFQHGEDMPSGDQDPCTKCFCYDGTKACMQQLCAQYPMCVDTDKGPDVCCGTCPNGPNCYLDGEIIPAGVSVDVPSEGPGCTKTCFCPENPGAYIETQNNTPANCIEACETPFDDVMIPDK